MIHSRRDFLKLGGIATVCGAFGSRVLMAAEDPALGLIFPPLNYPVPPSGGSTLRPSR